MWVCVTPERCYRHFAKGDNFLQTGSFLLFWKLSEVMWAVPKGMNFPRGSELFPLRVVPNEKIGKWEDRQILLYQSYYHWRYFFILKGTVIYLREQLVQIALFLIWNGVYSERKAFAPIGANFLLEYSSLQKWFGCHKSCSACSQASCPACKKWWKINQVYPVPLMLRTLGKIFSRRYFKIFFFFFSEKKRLLTFYANCWENLQETSKPVFLAK